MLDHEGAAEALRMLQQPTTEDSAMPDRSGASSNQNLSSIAWCMHL